MRTTLTIIVVFPENLTNQQERAIRDAARTFKATVVALGRSINQMQFTAGA